MKYSALIQNRKSVRAFTDQVVPFPALEELRGYYTGSVLRLIPGIRTELYFFGPDSGRLLEGAAGYNQFLVGAPQYLVLMSEKHESAGLNAGFIMEDLVLKLTAMDLGTCWLTFTDSEDVKAALGIESELDVAAIVAFGYGVKTTRRLRLNIRSMSNVDIRAKHQYFEPKRSVRELAFVNTWGNSRGLEDAIGFYDDMLWEALYGVSQAPSYLNRQAYGFVLHGGKVTLVRRPDEYTTGIDGDLSLGIALHHFTAIAGEWAGKIHWNLAENAASLSLPEGHKAIATCAL